MNDIKSYSTKLNIGIREKTILSISLFTIFFTKCNDFWKDYS